MQANNLRKGSAIIHNGQICVVTDYSHHTPGNKRAFMQITMKEIKSGRLITNKFASTEDIPTADLESRKAQYQYHDGEGFHFMDLEDYSSFFIPDSIVGEQKYYLRENDELEVDFHDGKAIALEIPPHVKLKVVESPPGVKGDSVSNTMKSAVLETGLTVQVPLFIKEGDILKIDTRTGNYLNRE